MAKCNQLTSLPFKGLRPVIESKTATTHWWHWYRDRDRTFETETTIFWSGDWTRYFNITGCYPVVSGLWGRQMSLGSDTAKRAVGISWQTFVFVLTFRYTYDDYVLSSFKSRDWSYVNSEHWKHTGMFVTNPVPIPWQQISSLRMLVVQPSDPVLSLHGLLG